jgi:hypothetical protein
MIEFRKFSTKKLQTLLKVKNSNVVDPELHFIFLQLKTFEDRSNSRLNHNFMQTSGRFRQNCKIYQCFSQLFECFILEQTFSVLYLKGQKDKAKAYQVCSGRLC